MLAITLWRNNLDVSFINWTIRPLAEYKNRNTSNLYLNRMEPNHIVMIFYIHVNMNCPNMKMPEIPSILTFIWIPFLIKKLNTTKKKYCLINNVTSQFFKYCISINSHRCKLFLYKIFIQLSINLMIFHSNVQIQFFTQNVEFGQGLTCTFALFKLELVFKPCLYRVKFFIKSHLWIILRNTRQIKL